MRYSSPALALVAILVLHAEVANATPFTFAGNLAGANEVPPTASTGTGMVTIILDPTALTLQEQVTFSGLTTPDNAAHIHCCAPLGTNAGVATAIPALPGFPLGVMSGTFDQTFSLVDPTFYNPAFVTANGGTVAGAEAVLVSGIENEQAYFNIHTTMNPGGEIRSQLFPTPEPATFILLGLALLGVALMRGRRSLVQLLR
jgi:hypothetical protein